MQRFVWLMGGVLVALQGMGCESTQRFFRVNSYPEGAVVYVNDEPRGQTNFEKLLVDFKNSAFVTVLVKKDGYQSSGLVLSKTSPERVTFFLEEAPSNESILRELDGLQRALDRLTSKVEMLESSGDDPEEQEE